MSDFKIIEPRNNVILSDRIIGAIINRPLIKGTQYIIRSDDRLIGLEKLFNIYDGYESAGNGQDKPQLAVYLSELRFLLPYLGRLTEIDSPWAALPVGSQILLREALGNLHVIEYPVPIELADKFELVAIPTVPPSDDQILASRSILNGLAEFTSTETQNIGIWLGGEKLARFHPQQLRLLLIELAALDSVVVLGDKLFNLDFVDNVQYNRVDNLTSRVRSYRELIGIIKNLRIVIGGPCLTTYSSYLMGIPTLFLGRPELLEDYNCIEEDCLWGGQCSKCEEEYCMRIADLSYAKIADTVEEMLND